MSSAVVDQDTGIERVARSTSRTSLRRDLARAKWRRTAPSLISEPAAMAAGSRSSQYVRTMTARCWMLSRATAASTSVERQAARKDSRRAVRSSRSLRRPDRDEIAQPGCNTAIQIGPLVDHPGPFAESKHPSTASGPHQPHGSDQPVQLSRNGLRVPRRACGAARRPWHPRPYDPALHLLGDTHAPKFWSASSPPRPTSVGPHRA